MTGSWTNRIEESALMIGDHIYRFNKLHLRVCHGIYVEEDRVIYYKCRRIRETSEGECERCGLERAKRGVVKSCLDCFLQGHHLYRFKYNVYRAYYFTKNSGTCYTGPCRKPSIVVESAYKMLNDRNRSITTARAYDEMDTVFEKNSVLFGVLCMTGSMASAKTVAGHSKVRMGSGALQLGLGLIGTILGIKEVVDLFSGDDETEAGDANEDGYDNESGCDNQGVDVNEGGHENEGGVVNEGGHENEGGFDNEGVDVNEGENEGGVLNEGGYDNEGVDVNEGGHENEGGVVNEGGHENEGGVVNQGGHENEGGGDVNEGP